MNYRLVWIYIQIGIYFAFALSNSSAAIVDWYEVAKRAVAAQSASVPRVVSSVASFCPSNPYSRPLNAIVVNHDGSIRGATLTGQGGGNSGVNIAEVRGTSLIFNKPPLSSCYILNASSANSIDMNKLNIQLVYDSVGSSTNDPTRSFGSGYDYGSNGYYPSAFNQNSYCGSVICQNGGMCRYTGTNGYQCQCDSTGRWLGSDCSKPNPCIQSPCANGGQCYYRQDATYNCLCPTGFTGSNCQSSLSPISTGSNNLCMFFRPCLNGGICSPSNNQGGYTCTCPQGYTGVNCQTSGSLTGSTGGQSSSCGISSLKIDSSAPDVNRIVGGTPVNDYSWPWIVSIQTMYGGSHFCGGTLVDAYHVITAAHCFDSAGTTPGNFKIVVGLLNMRQTNAANVQQLTVERIYRHEGYSSTKLVNDITVIKLRTPARFNSFVSPICLPSGNGAQDPRTNQNVLIAGWGYTDSQTKQIANQLQQATIQALDINGDLYGGPGCNAWTRRGYQIDNRQQICAMSRNTNSDSCQGDSGGPLIGSVGSKWYLFGIVSYGDSICGSSTAAGVYTRVSGYAAWIQQKLQL